MSRRTSRISGDDQDDTEGQAKSVRITRRGLVAGGVGIAAMVAVGGIGKAFAGGADLLRPPGGQDNDTLWGACIKCDRCRSACPMGVVDVAHLEDGLLNARTPKMDFRKGYCDFCANEKGYRCVDSCPTQALVHGFDPAADKVGMAVVDEQECLLYRSGSGMCSKQCIDACAFEALFLTEAGRLLVDEAFCNGCGACEYVCPSASYGSYTGSGRRGINIESWTGDLP